MEEQKNNQQPKSQSDNSDVEQNKVMAIIGYIFPILFFIPLINDSSKNSKFAKFHANQQLLFLIFSMGGYIIASVTMIIFIGFLIFPVVMVGSLVFFILGIINASKGEMKPLPIIGKYEIIK